MSQVKINLNDMVKVKLTDLGKDIYYHRYDELNRRCGRIINQPKFPEEDEEGYTQFQLWDFINLYGNHIGMTKPNVIEPLNIVFEDEAFEEGWRQALENLAILPAAEVVEVVHSEWDLVDNEQYAVCLSCECCIPMAWSDDEVYWNYCPNCGAKMDGGQDDV